MLLKIEDRRYDNAKPSAVVWLCQYINYQIRQAMELEITERKKKG